MKFLPRGLNINHSKNLVYLNENSGDDALPAVPDIIPSNLQVPQEGNLDIFKAAQPLSTNNSRIISGSVENSSASMPAETAEFIQGQVAEIVDQSTETAIQKSFNGERLARRFTLERFGGFNTQLYDPRFWFGINWINPKQVILDQVTEAFSEVGDPASLVEGSALISDGVFRSLINKNIVKRSINILEKSGGNAGADRELNNVSLTSLELLRDTFIDRNQRLQAINAEQVGDFTAKAENEVWWKQYLRKPFFQAPLQRQKIKVIQKRNQAAHVELLSILDGVIQNKEQNVFTARQNVDQAFLVAENASANQVPSVGMTGAELGDQARQTIHRVLNRPEEFVRNPQSFQGRVPLKYLFGEGFIPLDILEALKTSKYEKYAGRDVNYVDSAIATNQWEISHYNALRTLNGLQERKTRLTQFNKTSFQNLESLVNQVYEPSQTEVDVDNPTTLVAKLKLALESATPQLSAKVSAILDTNIYAGATEQFWALSKYFNDHPVAFKALPPDLQQDYAGFFIQKRTDLEKALVSGAQTEDASALWRAQALTKGQDVLSKVDTVAALLPDLGTKLLSREAGVAQGALQELQGLQGSFKFFTDIVGENLTTGDGTTKSLYEKLPELEQGLLDNVFLMKNFIEQVNTSLVSLREKRVEFEALLDVDPDLVKSQQKIMEELQPKIETAGSGLDDIRSSIGGFGGVNSQDGAEGADTMNTTGGGLEPRFKTLQREVDQLRQTLMGPAGNTDGGQIGAANKIIGYTYPVPGDISETVAQTAAVGRKLLAQRLEEIGVYDVENLLKNRPSFDDLARLEMGELVSRDIVNTAKTLLQNETAQQFERMKLNGRTFVKAHEIYLAEMNFQNDLTVEGVTNPMIIKDAQYLRTEENGEALIYHTTDLVIKILTPKIGSADSRNVLVYKKTEAEKGLGNFVPAYGNPDFLATLMTSRPENSAFANNALYGVTGKNIQANHPGVNRLQ